MRSLCDSGKSIVFITHKLKEVKAIADRITVIRRGRTVGTATPDTSRDELAALMVGRSVSLTVDKTPAEPGEPVLQVEGLVVNDERGHQAVAGVDLTVHAGEVVGLAGLVGAGRSEILETVYGARRASQGSVTVAGRTLRKGSVTRAVAAGMGLAPEERKSQGLLLDQAVYRNITVSSMNRFARAGFLNSKAERQRAGELTRSLDVRPPDVDRAAATLSGGNQQKIVLARWLMRDCKVLLLDEPTRGVDVGARSEIYKLVRALADAGVAVVVVSSEVEEVLGLADRVLVVREGVVVHEAPATELDESRVLDLVMEGRVA